jgi:hypothetical protein
METKRKTDLFRFATLRAPQLISKERRALGFIENLGLHHSTIFANLNLNATLDVLRVGAENNAEEFQPYESVEEIKALNPEGWAFSLWLAEYKDAIIRDELGDRIGNTIFQDDTVNVLWDNIYYDILKTKNPYVRQACMQLLIADNFIRNYELYSPNTDPGNAEEEAKLLKRLANGKLVIHPAITRKKNKAVAGVRQNHLPAYKQEQKIKGQIAALHTNTLKKIEGDLLQLKKQYNSEYSSAFKSVETTYQGNVKMAVTQFLTENPALRTAENLEKVIPDSLSESLIFSFAKPLSPEYLSEKVSEDTIQFIAKNNLDDSGIDDALNLISTEKKAMKVNASGGIQKKISEIVINGVQIRANSEDSKEFALSFEPTDIENEYLVYLSMDAGYKGAYFTEGSFSLLAGGEEAAVNFENPCLKPTDDNSIFIKITDEPFKLDPCVSYTFLGSVTMNNGESYSIEKSGNSNILLVSGRAYRMNGAADETVIYGVNRIGVIDYRKVEQELCCYIPGEVSHIENIMAKEYKDRTTRSLSRVEQTTELTSEQEVETSTDTTTTERNELSSEMAKIIDKDRSTDLGFTASASGGSPDTYQWAAGGTADFSFGQSTSNSNTIARTKAKELTQRALERVVQKVSSTRTSKMLREFEDSNTHGFDNRKGNTHITGVYRWVDKVYKNRIVNYGKRLIYEFMVPEPSRWYKEAVIVEKEESDASGQNSSAGPVLVKPTHPKENNIGNAESITRENFSQLGSLYGVQITAPQDKNISVSDSHSAATGTDDDTHYYNDYEPVIIPTDYSCVRITGAISGRYKSYSAAYASLIIGVGPKVHTKNFGDGAGNFSDNFDFSGFSLSPSTKATMTTRKIVNVTVSLNYICELSSERYKQWQQDAYSSIMDAYNQQLAEYNAALSDAQAALAAKEATAKEENEAVSSNSKFNAEIIHTELKRLCIEMLTTPFGRPQGKDLYLPGECKVPKLALSPALDEYASQVKFFEQAFDWSIISQLFYPYYWAKKCDWKALFQSQDSADLIFQAFLQSGMARVMVPVRQGFEDAVVFYMETGRIWNGSGLVVDTDDELYLSIVDEMTDIKGFTEGDEWETIVPSDLTIIQAKSAFLEDEGLPCCEENDALPVNMKFQGTDAVLIAKDETEEEPINP